MSIKVGSLDLNQYAIQTRQALEAYQGNRSDGQTVAESRSGVTEPVSSHDLSTVLSDEERQALSDAFGGNVGMDNNFLHRTNALILKGSRIDLTI
jgi:hypothetical protein